MNNKLLISTFFILATLFFLRSTEVPTGDEPSTIAAAYSIVEGDRANIGNIKKLRISDKLGVGGEEHCQLITATKCLVSHEIGLPIIFSIPLFTLKSVGVDIYSANFLKNFVNMLRIFGIIISSFAFFKLLEFIDKSNGSIIQKLILLNLFIFYPFLAYSSTLTSDLYGSLLLIIILIYIIKSENFNYPLFINIFPFLIILINTRIGILSVIILGIFFINSISKSKNKKKIVAFGVIYGSIGLASLLLLNHFFYGNILGLQGMAASALLNISYRDNIVAFTRYIIDHREGLFIIFPFSIYIYSYALSLSLKRHLPSLFYLVTSIIYILVLASAPSASGLHLSGRYVLPLCIISVIYFSLYYFEIKSHSLIALFLLVTPSFIITFNVIRSDFFGFTGLMYGNFSYLLPHLYCPSNFAECYYGNFFYIPLILFIYLVIYFSTILKRRALNDH